MEIWFGSARINEKNGVSGGAPGDQKQTSTPDKTGEVAIEKFYVHKLGWYILRAKNEAQARQIAVSMLRACNNANIGYDQGTHRLGVVKYGTAATVKTGCDCGSLVRQCVKEATGKDAGNFNTGSERKALLNTGLFTLVEYTGTNSLREGDILVTKTQGHTGVIVSAPTASNGVTVSDAKDVFYAAYCNGKWQDEVKSLTDYAGIENKAISGVMVRVPNHTVKVRVRRRGTSSYLDWASGYDPKDNNNGYAGIIGKPIDRLQMKMNSGHIMYRVSIVGSVAYLPWVTDATDYAGLNGKEIDKIQICLK